MYTFLLQDWITMRGTAANAILNQSESGWLDLSGFQDVVAWADVKGITSGGGTPVLTYQTSPSKDDTLFLSVGENVGAAFLGVNVSPLILSSNSAAQPLARWLRWQLVNSSQTTTWDMTFRVFVSANPGGGRRKSLGGVLTAPSMRAGVPASPGAPGSIRSKGGSGGSSGGGGGGTTGGGSTGTSSSAGSSIALPYAHTVPSTPLHLQSSPGSVYTGGAGASAGSVPRVTPGSSGPHGPARPTGPSVPLHRKPRGPTR